MQNKFRFKIKSKYLVENFNKSNMKTTFKNIMVLSIITSSLLITGCQKDLYDPEYVASKNGLLTGVSSDFNWSTISSVNLTVNVDDQYNGQYYYVVEAFDSNPIIDSNAKLLTKGVAKKGQSFSSVVSVPQTAKSIAIRQTSPTGLTVTRMVDVASNVTLDFGTTATKSISTRSSSSSVLTRSANDTDKNDFVSTMPADAITYDQNQVKSIKKFKLENGTYDINEWNSGAYLYASGKVHITNLYLAPSCKLYILPGAEVTLDTGNNLGQSGVVVSIAENASLKVGTLTPSSNVKILNKGTISASEIQLAESSLLYNAGTVSVSGNLSGQNASSTIENDGTITALNLLVQGNSILSNYNVINVSNLTTVDCTGGSWTNEGHYTTKSMAVSAHNSNVFNKCKLVVTDDLKFNTGNIKIDGGAYVSCSTLYMDNSKIEMGANSIMKVSTQATYNYNPLSGGYGFYGPTSGKALLKLKKAIANNNGQNYVINYSGNIQIECEDHPGINVDNYGNIRFTQDPVVEWVKEGETTITISSSNCSEGNTPSQGGTPSNPSFPIAVEPDKDYTFAMEDSWPNYGDYDMNDLVTTIRTSYLKNSSNKATQMTINVTLRAVGALKTIGAALQMDNILASNIQQVTNTGSNLDGSIFERNSAGIENGQSKAVIPLFDNAHKFLKSNGITNTIVGKNNVPAQTAEITISFKNPISVEDADIKSLNFFIVTDGKKDSRTEIHLAGYTPTDKFNKSLFGTEDDNSVSGISFTSKNEHLVWGMIIPTIFNYPVEYEKITNAYPYFGTWAKSTGKENQNWYNSPKSGFTY